MSATDELSTTSSSGGATESRVERKRSQRVVRILEATAEVLGRQGMSRFSLEEVADRLDVTKGSLYHYFPSKEELVISAIETLAGSIMVELRAVTELDHPTATEMLRALLAKQITVVVWDYPASIELFTLREPDDVARRVKVLRARHDELFRGVVEKGLATGEFHVASMTATLECIYSSINLSPLWIRRESRAEAARQIEELLATLMMLVGVGATAD